MHASPFSCPRARVRARVRAPAAGAGSGTRLPREASPSGRPVPMILPAGRPGVTVTGDTARTTVLLGHIAAPDPDFAIVTF